MISKAEWIERAVSKLNEFGIDRLSESGLFPDEGRFLPVITYPPITMYPEADPDTLFAMDPNPPDLPNAAYVHIPFCASQCTYCHWIKLINPPEDEVDDYLDTLAIEMETAARRLETDSISVTSVLFGGGTPTFLTPRQLERVLGDFTKYFDISSCRQFSFEAEPVSLLGDIGKERLSILRDYGVDRISLGAQSFEDHILSGMGRSQTGQEVFDSITAMRQAGIASISIDLIYGYPGQSIEDWINTLETAVRSEADAWQLYRLRILRHGDIQGPILDKYEQAPDAFVGLDDIRLMKALGWVVSENAGYDQHFTRIFAKEKSHVTQFMWDYCCNLTNVVGVGISSWGNYHRIFTQNIAGDFDLYRRVVRQDRLPIDRGLYRDNETEARRSLIAPLKNDRVYKKRFIKRLGFAAEDHFKAELNRLASMGLLGEDDKTIYLTDTGRFFADETMFQLHQRKYLPFPELGHDLMPD